MKFVTTKRQAALEVGKNIGIGILALVLAGALNFYMGRKIMQISRSLSQNRKMVAALLARGETSQATQANLDLVGDNDQKIQNAFVPADNISDYLAFLNNTSRQNAVQQALHFSEPLLAYTQGDLKVDDVKYATILTNGRIGQLVNYLKALEKAPYVQKVDSLKINGTADGGWNSAGTSATFNSDLYVRE